MLFLRKIVMKLLVILSFFWCAPASLVMAEPIVVDHFTASTLFTQTLQGIILSWRIRGAVRVDIQDGFRNVLVPQLGNENYIEVWPARTAMYTLIARGAAGELEQRSLTITVQLPEPSIDICSVTPNSINKGDVAVLQWSSRNTVRTEVIGNSFFWHEKPTGSMQVAPSSSTAYTIRAYASDGRMVTCAAAVNVYDMTPNPYPNPNPYPYPYPYPYPNPNPNPYPYPYPHRYPPHYIYSGN